MNRNSLSWRLTIPMTDHSAHRFTPSSPPTVRPRLLADIGGTNARFALEMAPGSIG